MTDSTPVIRQNGSIARHYQGTIRLRRFQTALRPLVPLYRVAIALRNFAWDRGVFTAKKLDCPVISVGNITAGGTGKTPLLIHLARHFATLATPVIVLTRGYARRSRDEVLLAAADASTPDRTLLERCGDEPLLIARNVPGVLIGIGSDRWRVGRRACERLQGKPLVLLDDGFQHRRLSRSCDILVIDASQPLEQARLLPAGYLREPLTSMKRARCIVINRRHIPPEDPRIKSVERCLDTHAPDIPRFWLDFRPEGLIDLRTGEKNDCDSLRGRPLLAVSGIGNPDAFEQTLSTCHLTIAGHLVYPDHHQFSGSDAKTMSEHIHQTNAAAVVTTEKDSMRLLPLKDSLDASVPFLFLRIVPLIENEAAFFETIHSMAASHEKR